MKKKQKPEFFKVNQKIKKTSYIFFQKYGGTPVFFFYYFLVYLEKVNLQIFNDYAIPRSIFHGGVGPSALLTAASTKACFFFLFFSCRAEGATALLLLGMRSAVP